MSQTELDETAVTNFREFLRTKPLHPNIDHDVCLEFLRRQAQSLDLPIKIYQSDSTIAVLKWEGTQPTKPSILLNSHINVAPVFEDNWTYPPFSARMDEQGNIYGRGSQNMKSVGIQYLEAIRRLKLNGQRCQRTIHVSFDMDHKIGSDLGMKTFVRHPRFKALNVGFALDAGLPSPNEHFFLFNEEKPMWRVKITCAADSGNELHMSKKSAGEKLRVIIDRFMDFRASEIAKLTDPRKLVDTLAGVTSVVLTNIWGRTHDIIQDEFSAWFDIRLSNSVDHEEFEATIERWCEEAGPDVTYSFEQKNPKIEHTKLDNSNPFWIAFKKTCDEIGVELDISSNPMSTDSHFMRVVGIPALCFSPINKTELRIHKHNEYLNKDIFLKGIEIYTKVIPSIANV